MTMTIRKTKRSITRTRCFFFCLAALMLAATFAAAEDNPAKLAGKWQLSWEARLGTERGTMQLDQVGSKLTGTFEGGSLGSPKISGNIECNTVTLNIEFQRTHPFTIIFKGTLDGDKMGGKFEIQGVQSGYDSHGENATPSNYSWTAVRQPDQTQSASAQQKQSDPKEKLHSAKEVGETAATVQRRPGKESWPAFLVRKRWRFENAGSNVEERRFSTA
jgi:hypothetical protein